MIKFRLHVCIKHCLMSNHTHCKLAEMGSIHRNAAENILKALPLHTHYHDSFMK